MSYDWTSDDDNPSLPEGYHLVEVTSVRTEKKGGGPHLSKNNERMIWATVTDTATGDTQDICLMIEGNGVFNLKRLLKCAGADMEAMKAKGVSPLKFGEQAFAEKQLVGRRVWVYAELKSGRTNLDFRKEEDVPPQTVKQYRSEPAATPASSGGGLYVGSGAPNGGGAHKPVPEDDIPF